MLCCVVSDERYLPPESLQPDIAVQPSPETLYHISLQFDRAPARPMVARAAVYGVAGDTGFYEVTVSNSSERCVFEIEAGEAILMLLTASDADRIVGRDALPLLWHVENSAAASLAPSTVAHTAMQRTARAASQALST